MYQFLSLAIVVFAYVSFGVASAHPQVEACGGVNANEDQKIHDPTFVSGAAVKRIESFLQEADGTPGAAVVIVKGNRIAYAQGFGYRNLARCEMSTPATRFYLKSTTKTMLGIAAAVLHEEGAIELDAPISEYLPGLQLPDGLAARQTSIRDHLTHTQPYFDAGLNYRTAFPGNLSKDDYVSHVNEYSIEGDIRFRYSNFGPIMAAHAIGTKTDSDWRDLINSKVFAPAGMTNSFTSIDKAANGPMATSYLGGEADRYRETLTKTDAQMHAAGGAVSTASDLGRLLLILLDNGSIGGKHLLPRKAIEQVKSRQVQLSAEFLDYTRFAYGLGLYMAEYDGDLLMHHFGGETHFSFMPEHGIGVAVLANEPAFASSITHHLASTIYDMLLDKPDVDQRIERRLRAIDDRRQMLTRRLTEYVARLKSRAPGGDPSFGQAEIAGTYLNPRLGEMEIVARSGELRVDYGAQVGPLTHVGGDGYLAEFGLWGAPPELFVFRVDDEIGRVLDWGGRIFVKR